MIISSEQWHDLWDSVVKESLESTEKGIAIFYSLQEVETVCAVKMLMAGLKVHDIYFATYPVDNYQELRNSLHCVLDGSMDFRTVVLINCGAAQYVGSLQPASCQNVRFVVVDSHRPVCPRYNNNEDLDCVLLMDTDDPLQLADIPVADPLDDLTEEQRQEIEEFARQEQQEDEDRDSGDEREASTVFREHWARVRKRDRLLANYFEMGSSYGKPSPLVLQPLVEELVGKPDLQVLWPCCVGLTDQWIHQRISAQHYEVWYAALTVQVRSQWRTPLQEQQQQQDQQQNRNYRIPSKPCIIARQDYRLMLYRHWSLYDAFAYSSYVAPRMQTWRQAGQDNLNLLLAHMGIKVENAKRHYCSLKEHEHKAMRDKLRQGIVDSKSRITYEGLTCEGFALLHNLQTTAASDVVHAATALLTEPALLDTDGAKASAPAFWAAAEAIDAYSTRGWQQFRRGVEMAKYMQEAIIKDGGLMVSDRLMTINRYSRMQELNLQQMPTTNAKEFRHPLTLLRLAQFVRDATKVARCRAFNYPVLVVGPEDAQGWCLVIGLRGEPLASKPQYNVFGRTLKAILESPDSQAQWDHSRECFDSAVVYVHKNSIANFLLDVREALLTESREAEAAKQQEQQHHQGQQRSRDDAGNVGEDSRDSQRRKLSEQDVAAATAADGGDEVGDAGAGEELVDSQMEEEENVIVGSEDVEENDDENKGPQVE